MIPSDAGNFVLEGVPDDDQKERLTGLLEELMLLTRKYELLLVDDHETLQFQDLRNGNLIGVGLVGFACQGEPRRIRCYVAADSILDGVWEVDTDLGPQEQHKVGHVFPLRVQE